MPSRVVRLGRPEPEPALVGDGRRAPAVCQPSSTSPRPIMNAASAYVVPTQTSALCSLDPSIEPSGRVPLTAPIRPPPNPRDVAGVDRCAATASTRSSGEQRIAQTRRVGVPLAGQLVGHEAVRARAAAVVVGVVVATPQADVERDLGRARTSRSSDLRPRVSPRRRAMASAAAVAASQSEPPYADGPRIGQVS